jgi:dTDP-4-amino-4,6-dideoxygalactose transaminase
LRVADVPAGFTHAAYKLYVYIDPSFFVEMNPDKFERKNAPLKGLDDPSASFMSQACGADISVGPSLVKIRDWVLQEIQDRGVPCAQGTCSEVYLEKAFMGTGWRPENRLPLANELGDSSIMFLVHPTLTAAEIDMTCRVLSDVMQIACSR